ncbi:MAG: tetratricopeptide repeat protein [bacterium]
MAEHFHGAPRVAPMAVPPTTSNVRFGTTLLVAAVVMAAFLAADLALARMDVRESRVAAAALYDQGRVLLVLGKASEAGDRFATALSMERGNLSYARALAQAELQDGRAEEAGRTLQDVLNRAETDGAANLLMARVLVRQRRPADAKSYFHRAIYGKWGADSVSRSVEARLELIDLLATRHSESELLAELLPLEAMPNDSLAPRRRLAHLFIEAGAPDRASEIFRALLSDDPRDADAYAGLGEAALALGNFRAARADYAEAARLLPRNARIVARAALADTVYAISPSVRGIGAVARDARSRALLDAVSRRVDACAGTWRSALSDSAHATLARVAPKDGVGSADAQASLAGDLWSARPAACRDAFNDDALTIVLRHMAQ